MGMALVAVGGLFGLVAFVCEIIIIIHAFKTGGALHGLLAFCIPLYALYWGFAKFEHAKKGMILGGWLGGAILCGILQGVGASMQAAAAMGQ
jgi:hypothetical protein